MMFSSCYARGRFRHVSCLKVWKSRSHSCSNTSFKVFRQLFLSHVELWRIIFWSYLFLKTEIHANKSKIVWTRTEICLLVFRCPSEPCHSEFSTQTVLISGRLCSALSPPWFWLLMKCHHFVWRNHVARAKQNNPQAQSCGCNYRAASPSCLFLRYPVKKTPLLWSINTFLNEGTLGHGTAWAFKRCILKANNWCGVLEMCMRRKSWSLQNKTGSQKVVNAVWSQVGAFWPMTSWKPCSQPTICASLFHISIST